MLREISPSQNNEESRSLLGAPTVQSDGLGSQIRELFPEYVGRSRSVLELLHLVYKASKTDSSVLISGESGTGKELIAAAVHRLSARSRRKFVPINCSAIPETLLETELFGSERGAYTGAVKRAGLFEIAQGGTIFLDEIGDMPPNLQVKLLRVLQEKQYTPVGSGEFKRTDVRIVAATNVNLAEAVHESKFRLDLYYRLNVLPISLPALRERGDDVVLLVEHFLDLMNRQQVGQKPCFIDHSAMMLLRHYSWPGNIRELQNLIERLVIVSGGGRIGVEHLPAEISSKDISSRKVEAPSEEIAPSYKPSTDSLFVKDLPEGGVDLTQLVESLENSYILQALERTHNNKNQAARLLGLNRTTLVERIKKRKLAPLNLPSKEL